MNTHRKIKKSINGFWSKNNALSGAMNADIIPGNKACIRTHFDNRLDINKMLLKGS